MTWPVRALEFEGRIIEFLTRNSGSAKYVETFPIGAGHNVKISLTHVTGEAIRSDVPLTSDMVDFSMNFWSGSNPWLRIDNQNRDRFLHFHLASGSRPFEKHVPMEGEYMAAQLVTKVFDEAEEVLRWKYPDLLIRSGSA